MTEPNDYQLENIKNRELKRRSERRNIIVSDGQSALDKILDATSPAILVQSFPEQDLYYLMHKIGPDDFIPVLSMATSQQWEHILDVEVWDGDRFDLPTMTRVFDLLFQADAKRLLRWGIKEKPAFFEYYLSKHMNVVVREHDELPPSDFDDYITIDDKFYFRFPGKPALSDNDLPAPQDSMPAWELIEKMVKLVADMDLSVYHGLLLETDSLLLAEVEEEEFRLRNLRLAEKGFLPTHEAIGIYQPTSLDRLRKRPEKFADTLPFDPDIPLPPQSYMAHISGDDLFARALEHLDPDFIIQQESELAALVNKVIAADKIKLRTRQDLEKAIQKTHAYLNLGLEVILNEKDAPDTAPEIISQYFLEDIFRSASRACIRLKTKADKWFKNCFINKVRLPLSFMDETYLGVAGGLLIERPMFFDNYQTGKELYRDFKTLSDIDYTERALEEVIAIDNTISHLNIDIATFKQGVLTYKTLLLTLWARNRLNLPHSLEPIDISLFTDFFAALFSPTDTGNFDIQLGDLGMWVSETAGLDQDDLPAPFLRVLESLIEELDQEYGCVDPKDLDPRYIPHFLLSVGK